MKLRNTSRADKSTLETKSPQTMRVKGIIVSAVIIFCLSLEVFIIKVLGYSSSHVYSGHSDIIISIFTFAGTKCIYCIIYGLDKVSIEIEVSQKGIFENNIFSHIS